MKTLLVGIDETAECASVLAQAITLARQTGAKITLLHVVDVPAELPPPSSLLLKLPSSASELVFAARQRLALLADEVPEALRGDIVVETGHPASVLCRVARERNADLVVIGAHRHGPVRRALGTTAARVVNQLDRPVLVVRAAEAGPADERASSELRVEHQRLDGVFARLSQAYHDGEWADVQAEWTIFERALRAHMALEERELFPAFARADATETTALHAEHAELRTMLSTLGVAIDLHAVREPQIDELYARVREHGAREEKLFYPWVDDNPNARAASTTHAPSRFTKAAHA